MLYHFTARELSALMRRAPGLIQALPGLEPPDAVTAPAPELAAAAG
jgi:hypothetical protein